MISTASDWLAHSSAAHLTFFLNEIKASYFDLRNRIMVPDTWQIFSLHSVQTVKVSNVSHDLFFLIHLQLRKGERASFCLHGCHWDSRTGTKQSLFWVSHINQSNIQYLIFRHLRGAGYHIGSTGRLKQFAAWNNWKWVWKKVHCMQQIHHKDTEHNFHLIGWLETKTTQGLRSCSKKWKIRSAHTEIFHYNRWSAWPDESCVFNDFLIDEDVWHQDGPPSADGGACDGGPNVEETTRKQNANGNKGFAIL